MKNKKSFKNIKSFKSYEKLWEASIGHMDFDPAYQGKQEAGEMRAAKKDLESEELGLDSKRIFDEYLSDEEGRETWLTAKEEYGNHGNSNEASIDFLDAMAFWFENKYPSNQWEEIQEELMNNVPFAIEDNYDIDEAIEGPEIAMHKGETKIKETDPKLIKLEVKIKEYKNLSTDIDVITQKYEEMLEKELGKLPSQLNKVKEDIAKSIETLNIQKIKTDSVVISFRKAFSRTNVQYKTLWEAAITKVNSATRGVLEALVEQFTTESEISSTVSMSRESLEVNEGILDNIGKTIMNAIRKGAAYLASLLKGGADNAEEKLPVLEEATDELENITNQIESYEEEEADKEMPDWQAGEYR